MGTSANRAEGMHRPAGGDMMSPPETCQTLKDGGLVYPREGAMGSTEEGNRLVYQGIDNVTVSVVLEAQFKGAVCRTLNRARRDLFRKTDNLDIVEPRIGLDEVKVAFGRNRFA